MKTVIIGGFVDYEIQMAKSFNKKGDSMVIVYTTDPCLPPENEKLANDVNMRLLSRAGAIYNPITLVKFLLSSYRMLRAIRQFDPDVIHFQIGSPILVFYIPFLRRYPIVTTFHDITPHLGEQNRLEDYTLKYIRRVSSRIMVHGERLRQMMISDYHVPAYKVKSIPLGPHNIDAFKVYARNDIAEDGRTVLFFGRILKYKGLEYLIKAEPFITGEVPDAKIVIAGSGDDFKKYADMMVNKDHFIVYDRYIPYKEGAELLQRASVVALPYIEGSQSGVVSTVYGFKKPVVATNVGSIPEIVDDGNTGLIVPPGDPKALAIAIVKLLKDNELRRQMGENAYTKLNTDLSWDHVVEQTIAIYRSAIKNPDGGN